MSEKESLKNLKTIIVGKSSVGKSTILLRYIQGQFSQQNMTVAVDYQFKKVTAGGHIFNLELWDTAGQERYKTIVYSFFKLSKAACVVFDLTNESSLDDVPNWMDQLEAQCGKEIPKILLANKSDLLSPLHLQKYLQQIQPKLDSFRQAYECEVFVVSAKTGENIDKAFQHLANRLSRQIELQKEKPTPARITFKLNDKKEETRKRDKCCK